MSCRARVGFGRSGPRQAPLAQEGRPRLGYRSRSNCRPCSIPIEAPERRTPERSGSFAFLIALAVGLVLLASKAPAGDFYINEVMFNPPGNDSPNEYLEVRGTPNLVLSPYTYLLSVEGDAGGKPGLIRNVFDLGGKTIGGNGLLVLLQADSPYHPDPAASVYANTNGGSGWGQGSSSSIGHLGWDSLTDLKNSSVTFLLVRSSAPIVPGTDLDPGGSGSLDPPIGSQWTIEDAVGILDSDGAGDIAYGLMNFRRDTAPGNGALAPGVVIPIPFTPRYVARNGNSTGWQPSDWVASDVTGAAPGWTLGMVSNTSPASLAGDVLNHIGKPNFGAPTIPGIAVVPPPNGIIVSEVGDSNEFALALTVSPSGPVALHLDAGEFLRISTDGGIQFATNANIAFSDTNRHEVMVRAVDDQALYASPRQLTIATKLVATGDPVRYPLKTLTPQIAVEVLQRDKLLLNEACVNPPGTNDSPYEFVELKGEPGLLLKEVQLLVIDGDGNPGEVKACFNLVGAKLDGQGFLLVASTNYPFSPLSPSEIFGDAAFEEPTGALPNGAFTLMLVSSSVSFRVGDDLDPRDAGSLDALPAGTTILDSFAFARGNAICYSDARLELNSGVADAATRLSSDLTPNSARAWVFGELAGVDPGSLEYSGGKNAGNVPAGTRLTPGRANNTAPSFTQPDAISGVIGDPGNPAVLLSLIDAETPGELPVWGESSNLAVITASNINVTLLSSNTLSVSLEPFGVGYSDITLFSTDGAVTGRVAFPYAASAPGRPGGIWHIGACDGSAGVAIDPSYFWLGDDENQILRLYPRGSSSIPLRETDLTAFLNLPDLGSGFPREVDFEGATRFGDLLLWIGSHGHGVVGEPRTNRTRVVATRLEGIGASSTLSFVGHYDFLKDDFIEWDRLNKHGKGAGYYGLEASDADGVPPKAPDGSGLSIEGLTMVPGDTNAAYVAFRAPIVPATNRYAALILPVLNFVSLAAHGGPPGSSLFGVPIELDLYGRGIRSIEGDENGFILIGGPAGPLPTHYPQDFRLYSWNGDPLTNADQRTADLSGLNPEGIVSLPAAPWDADAEVEVVSDNGTTVFYGDGVPAKNLPFRGFKKCRSDRLRLGAITKPMPVVTSIVNDVQGIEITWRSLRGETYQLQTTEDPGLVGWQDVPGTVLAKGPYAAKRVVPEAMTAFFRVSVIATP